MGEGSSEGGQIGSGSDELGNNGMGVLGYKKVVVTGLVISATTVLVPPLVMGFAFWGPACAVLLGSYAFTRRVLSFLLPVPPGHIYVHDDAAADADDDDHEVEIEFEADPDVSNITLDDQKPAGLDEDTSGDLTGAVKESNQAIAPASEESKQADVDKQAGDDQGHERSAAVTAEKPGGSDKGQSDQDKSSAAAQVTSATATATETDQSKPGVPESPKNDTAQSSDKAFKTWEQIRAVRTIVGYTATPKSTCVEEVKALYLFTGVEPPVSFQDPTESEYAESDHNLLSLMSIIGVK